MSIESLIREMNKKFGDGAAMLAAKDDSINIERISSGILTLDLALGGGYPRGRNIELFGPEMSGKSTLAIYALIEYVKAMPDKAVLYVDFEHSLNINLMEAYGMDLDKVTIIHPVTGEEGLEMIEAFVRSGEVSAVVVDSVASMLPEAEDKSAMSDVTISLQARLMGKALRKLTGIAAKTKTTIFWINQLREKIGGYGNPEITPGGKALKFYASVRLSVRGGEKINVKGETIGHVMNTSVKKNKVGVPFKKASFNLTYGVGIDRFEELAAILIYLEIFKRSGAWYSLVDDDGVLLTFNDIPLKFQGKNSLIDFLKQHEEFYTDMESRIKA